MEDQHWLPHQLVDDSEDSDDSDPVPQRPELSPLNRSEGVISAQTVSIRSKRSLTPCPQTDIPCLCSTSKRKVQTHPPSRSFWQYQMKSERALPTAKMTQKIEALKKAQMQMLNSPKDKSSQQSVNCAHRSGSRQLICHRTDSSEFKRLHRMIVKGTSALPSLRTGKGFAMHGIHKKPVSPMAMMVVISPRVRPERSLGISRLLHVNRYS